jgi:hypothetical protein
MRLTRLAGGVAVLAIAVAPTVAFAGADHPGPGHGHPGGTSGPSGPSGPTGPSGGHGGSHKCKPHSEAYVAGGKVDSSSPTTPLTANGHKRFSGMLVVDVTKTNHHAAGDKGKTVTYKLDHARVVFSHGTSNPPAAGDRVQVIGRITTLNPRCDQTGFTPTVTIRQVVVHLPAPSGTTGPTGPTGPSSKD